MPAFLEKVTSMFNETLGGMSTVIIGGATLAIAVIVLLAVFTQNDIEKASKIKALIFVIAFCAFFAVSGPVINWAIS